MDNNWDSKNQEAAAAAANNASSVPLLYCRKNDATRGRYLVANPTLKGSIPEGRLIFCERPLVALQSLGNPVWVCHACKAFVGGPRTALQILATQTLPDLDENNDNDDDQDLDDCQSSWKVVPCRYKCGQAYCSTECEEDFWESRHRFLCTGQLSITAPQNENDDIMNDEQNNTQENQGPSPQLTNLPPLIQFKQQAVMTNEIFLLVAEWIVAEYTFRKQQKQQAQDTFAPIKEDILASSNPFEDFMMEPWWEIDAEEDSQEEQQFQTNEKDNTSPPQKGSADTARILKKLCEESANLWQEHWKSMMTGQSTNQNNMDIPKEYPSSSPLYLKMANVIGACELNSIGIRRRNPLCRDVFDKSLRLAQKGDILQCIDQAGMLQKGEHDNDNMETDNNEENNQNETDQTDEWEYTDDDLARFLAGLDIYEEEAANNSSNNETTNNDADADDDTDSEEEDDDNNNDQDDLDIIFPPLDGTAMYALGCKMNHSCDPNVAILYKTRGWGSRHPLVAHCIALRDIKPGEQLCISYIDSDRPRDERQKELQHYGFTCCCQKCEQEKIEGDNTQPRTLQVQDSIGAGTGGDEHFLFGSDDSDDESEKEPANENNQSTAAASDRNEQIDGETALEQRLSRLDTTLNQSVLGSVPLPYLAQVSTFVIQIATQAKTGLQQDEETGHSLLNKCVKALRDRDFVLAKTVGADLERLLFSLLKKESKWPTVAYREAYWCSCLTVSVGLTHSCCFLPAIFYLDKALILGFERKNIGDFFSYVDLHAAQVAIGPYQPAIASVVTDYTAATMRQHVTSIGLVHPIHFPVPEFSEAADEANIQSAYIFQGKPVVIRRHAVTWPSIQKWRNLSFFCRYHGHRTVPIEIGSMRSKDGMKEELITIRTFIAKYLTKSAERDVWSLRDAVNMQHSQDIAYLAQHPLIQQLPGLGSDINLQPGLCGSLGPSHVYLWIGTGGTRTPLHYDTYSNLFVQLVGVKYVRIYGVGQTSKLYVSKKEAYGLQGNMSDVDCEQEDYSLHPSAKDAAYEEVLLFPGDLLFIPARAWHYVRSLSTSMSVNFWF